MQSKTGRHLEFCFISDPEVERAYVSSEHIMASAIMASLPPWINPLLVELIQVASSLPLLEKQLSKGNK